MRLKSLPLKFALTLSFTLSFSVPVRIDTLNIVNLAANQGSATQSARAGSNNVVIYATPPANMGDNNVFIGATDSHGNTILNRGGVAVGSGACADSTSTAIGANANAGSCASGHPRHPTK